MAGCTCDGVNAGNLLPGQQHQQHQQHQHQQHPIHSMPMGEQRWLRKMPPLLHIDTNQGKQHGQQQQQQHQQQQQTQILHSILSVQEQQGHEVNSSLSVSSGERFQQSSSPQSETQARFPTPPSSIPGSPHKLQNNHGEFVDYGSNGDFSSMSSRSSIYSLNSAAGSPRTLSPVEQSVSADSTKVSGQWKSALGYSIEPSWTPGCNTSNADRKEELEDQPINLKRCQPQTPPEQQFECIPRQNINCVNGGDVPMDLSTPSKKRRLATLLDRHIKPSSESCEKGLDLSSTASTPISLKDNVSCHKDQHSDGGVKRINPHLAYYPVASVSPSAPSSSQSPSPNESILKSILCGQLSSKPAFLPQDKTGNDRNASSPFMYTLSNGYGLTRTPAQRVAELIQRAKEKKLSAKPTSPLSNMGIASAAYQTQSQPLKQTQQNVSCLRASNTIPPSSVSSKQYRRSTIVSLATKNLLAVTVTISEWLINTIQYVKSVPEYQPLPVNDKVNLIQNAWSHLLLLKMAESNFQFAVEPTPANKLHTTDICKQNNSSSGLKSSPVMPTLETVEIITGFIQKCQGLKITSDEMRFLKHLTLFNPSNIVMESGTSIQNINTYVRKCLQDACIKNSNSSSGNRRYCQLLLVFPTLFSIRTEVVESLFCKHITTKTDMELLLKEMLHSL